VDYNRHASAAQALVQPAFIECLASFSLASPDRMMKVPAKVRKAYLEADRKDCDREP
jgi:hypothetical protein